MMGEWINLTMGDGHAMPCYHVQPDGERRGGLVLVQEISDQAAVEGAPRAKVYVSSLVLQNVRVLGMDLIADPASTDKFPPKTATLEVTVMDAGKLAAAAEAGTLSLSLRRSGATEIAEIPTMSLEQMMRSDRWAGIGPAGAPPRRVAVRRPPSDRAPAASSAPTRGLVVTQGDKRSTVTVPTERTGS